MNFSTTAKKEKPPKAAFRFLSFPVERIFCILKSKHKGFLNDFSGLKFIFQIHKKVFSVVGNGFVIKIVNRFFNAGIIFPFIY